MLKSSILIVDFSLSSLKGVKFRSWKWVRSVKLVGYAWWEVYDTAVCSTIQPTYHTTNAIDHVVKPIENRVSYVIVLFSMDGTNADPNPYSNPYEILYTDE